MLPTVDETLNELKSADVDVTKRYGIMEGYFKGWDIAFSSKETFEKEWAVQFMTYCRMRAGLPF